MLNVTLDAAKIALDTWFDDRHAESVQRVHVDNPAKDPHARYEVIREIAFEPASLEVGRVELWFTKSGEISIGFETVERVAKRLGVRAAKSGFAAGHEPQAMSK